MTEFDRHVLDALGVANSNRDSRAEARALAEQATHYANLLIAVLSLGALCSLIGLILVYWLF